MTSHRGKKKRWPLIPLILLGLGALMFFTPRVWLFFPTTDQKPPEPTRWAGKATEAAHWMDRKLHHLWSDLGVPKDDSSNVAVRSRSWEGERWEMRIIDVAMPGEIPIDRVLGAMKRLEQDSEHVVRVFWAIEERALRAADLWTDGFLTHRIFFREAPEDQKALDRVVKRPQIALIVDDLGNAYAPVSSLFEMELPLTYSVFPKRPFTRKIADETAKKGLEVMMHLPMEPRGYPEKNPGHGALFVNMGPEKLKNVLREDLRDVPRAKGVNNHMGSRFTEHKDAMRWVLEVLAQQEMYFVDSLTTPRSVGFRLARKMGMKTLRRDVFLDVIQDRKTIRKQFAKLIRVARLQGYAIGICHPYPETLKMLPMLHEASSKEGIQWVRVSQLRSPGS